MAFLQSGKLYQSWFQSIFADLYRGSKSTCVHLKHHSPFTAGRLRSISTLSFMIESTLIIK